MTTEKDPAEVFIGIFNPRFSIETSVRADQQHFLL